MNLSQVFHNNMQSTSHIGTASTSSTATTRPADSQSTTHYQSLPTRVESALQATALRRLRKGKSPTASGTPTESQNAFLEELRTVLVDGACVRNWRGVREYVEAAGEVLAEAGSGVASVLVEGLCRAVRREEGVSERDGGETERVETVGVVLGLLVDVMGRCVRDGAMGEIDVCCQALVGILFELCEDVGDGAGMVLGSVVDALDRIVVGGGIAVQGRYGLRVSQVMELMLVGWNSRERSAKRARIEAEEEYVERTGAPVGVLQNRPKVRSQCLSILANLTPVQTEVEGDHAGWSWCIRVQECCSLFLKDNDPRVRAAALRAMIVLHRRGAVLDLDACCFDTAYRLSRDGCESVRIEMARLLWIFSNLYPEREYCCNISDSFVDEEEEAQAATMEGEQLSGSVAAFGKATENAGKFTGNRSLFGPDSSNNAASDKFNGRETRMMRLVDCGFSTLCDFLNDSSVRVRVIACSFLGQLKDVDKRFLMQTLDKKLMSHMKKASGYGKFAKRKESRIADQSNHIASMLRLPKGSVGSSGASSVVNSPSNSETSGGGGRKAKRGVRKRRPSINPEGDSEMFMNGDGGSGGESGNDVKLVNSGSCGAFVLGLEDEFYEVRNNSIDAMCELSLSCEVFAKESLDFLTDMLNDEIDSVRLNAIYSLTKLSDIVEVDEEQLDIILAVLEDGNAEIRRGIHQLLSSVKLDNIVCLHACAQGLISNLEKHPDDCSSIWKNLQRLGLKYPVFCEFLLDNLLGIDPNFAQTEPNVESRWYVSALILIFNAASKNERMLSLFPSFLKRHYEYLSEKYPRFIPPLLRIEPIGMSMVEKLGEKPASPSAERAIGELKVISGQDKEICGHRASGIDEAVPYMSESLGAMCVDFSGKQKSDSERSASSSSQEHRSSSAIGLECAVSLIEQSLQTLTEYHQRMYQASLEPGSDVQENLTLSYFRVVEKVKSSLKICTRDLKRAKQLSGTASRGAAMAECHLLFLDFISLYLELRTTIARPGKISQQRSLDIITQLKQIVGQMKSCFVGLDARSLLIVRQWELLIMAFELVGKFKLTRSWGYEETSAMEVDGATKCLSGEGGDSRELWDRFVDKLRQFECLWSQSAGGAPHDGIVSEITGKNVRLSPSDSINMLCHYWTPIYASSSHPKVRQLHGRLLNPVNSQDHPHTFVSGMPLCLFVDIHLENASEQCRSSLVVILRFPDGSTSEYRPYPRCFELTSSLTCYLRMPITVKNLNLTSSSFIEVSLRCVVQIDEAFQSSKGGREINGYAEDAGVVVVTVIPPRKFYIKPKDSQ